MKKRMAKLLRSQSGVALIVVILIISILIAAALEFNRSSRADVYLATTLSDGLQLTCMAKSGFYGGAALVVNSKNAYETLRDEWANAEILSMKSGTLFNNGRFVVRIEDESGKIPLNVLTTGGAVNENLKKVLIRLLSLPEFEMDERKATEIADAIIDWIDENSEITGLGAESSYYAGLTPPYSAKNGPLDCIEELLMVRGVTNELFAGDGTKPALVSLVTIYGKGKINLNTAPKLVLRALSSDISAERADKIDEYRRSAANNLASVDWYKNVIGMEGVTINPDLIEVTKSNFFRIYATGVTDQMQRNVSGVIRRSPFQILSWRQD